jgi:hypothetical protein
MAADQGDVRAHYCLGHVNEQQGKYEAALMHYRAGRTFMDPEKARNCIRRCAVAVERVKQEDLRKR